MRYFISILGLAVIVGAGYFGVAQYVNVVHGQSSLLTADSTSGSANAATVQVLGLLTRLQKIKLDDTIFHSQNFQALQDWSVDIAPQTVSRPNPFLPVVGAAPAVAPSTKISLPKSGR